MGETRTRILVLGSPGNDSLCSAIADSGLACEIWSEAATLRERLARDDVAAAVITTNTGSDFIGSLIAALDAHPGRPALPIVAIVDGVSKAHARLEPFGAISLGPAVTTTTVVNVLRMAVRTRQAQYDLRDSEQRFAQFMRHLPGLAWIKGLDGRYTYVNAAAEKAFQASAAELYGKVDEEIFPFETARLFAANDRRVLDEKRELLTRETLLQNDGRIHHSIVSKFPIPGLDDRPALIGGMAFDITEWKEAEIAEALLAAIVESSEDAMISMTLDGTITSWNAAAERLYGYSAAEAIGCSITLVVLPEHHDDERKLRDRLKRGERIDHYETVRRRKDGRLVDISVTMSPIRNKSGAIVGASKVARDITVRKQTQTALRRSEERFRLLAETAPCFVWTAAADGTVEYANRRWKDYADPIAARDLRDWPLALHPDDLERCISQWHQSLSTATEYEIEVRIRRFDGAYRWFVIRAVPLHGDDNRVIAWFGVTVDVHDHKELTEKLREADRHKDEFLATLGHELRNPLAPIQHSIELLRMKDCEGPSREQALSRMERQMHHLVRLVDDLLQISRVSRGRIELRPEREDLESIIHSALETSRPLIAGATHQVEIDLPSTPLLIEADAVRLEQMIANLLNNAAKFTNPGGRIRVKAFAEGGEVVISVRDNGIGIAADMLPRVFEMFTQADKAPGAATYDGLGIGLALVKILAELHGGSVKAMSAGREQGSEFVLRLPILARKSAPQRKPASSSVATQPKARILVVDDNYDAAETLGMLLRTVGHDVVLAHDGATALVEARVHHPDIVLLDIAMPDMDGYEVAQRLRQLPDLGGVLLIAVSGYSENRTALVQAGFDAYFVKPVDFGTLSAQLTSHLKSHERSNGL